MQPNNKTAQLPVLERKDWDELQTIKTNWKYKCSFLAWPESFLKPHKRSYTHLPTDIIRFLTFERLKLTHTCCYLDHDGGWERRVLFRCEEDEVQEIRDEQRFLIQELEDLVRFFLRNSTKSGRGTSHLASGHATSDALSWDQIQEAKSQRLLYG